MTQYNALYFTSITTTTTTTTTTPTAAVACWRECDTMAQHNAIHFLTI